MGSIACDNPSPAVCFTERRYQNRNLQLPRPPRSHPPPGRARAEGETIGGSMVGSALKVGDGVRLIAETLAWRAEITLQGQIGEIIERREDGRITIRFDNGRLLMARDPESFELVSSLGLKAKK